MQLRRRCRRCYFVRSSIYLVIFFVITSVVLLFHRLDINALSDRFHDRSAVFLVDADDLVDAKISTSSFNVKLWHEDYFNTTHLACQYPALNIDNPEIWKHLTPVTQSQPDCEKSLNWVFVENGTFRLSQQALQKHGPIVCAYRPILRAKDDFSTMEGARLFPVVDRMPLVSDFFRADCRARDGSFYSNIHSGIMFDAGLHMRHIWNPMIKTHLGYNVLMFGFDSVSRMTFMRFLPKSYSYLIKQLGGIVLKGYNIVGDGTPAALLPILTGQTEQELPEARRGHANAETVDRFPWIWNKFKDNGYVTQWGEDLQNVGTFQMRLKGFREPPVDHYARPFYLVAESMRTSKPFCFGSMSRFQSMLDWIRDFFQMYPNQPKFSFLFHSQYSHDTNNRLPYADDELLEFLRFLHENGYLDRTMLILMTDHGARFSSLRKTYQGKLEERLPFVSIRMPRDFQEKFPQAIHNLRTNSHRLTTPFDLHETLQHLFEFHSLDPYQPKSNRSFSLFQLIPENRTCSQAAIEQHWCACLNWNEISTNQTLVQQLAEQAVGFLNKFVSDHRDDCATLTLHRLFKANQLQTNEHLMKFVGSSDKDGRVPSFHDSANHSRAQPLNQSTFYQIQFETIPGHGQFELTAEYRADNRRFLIEKKRLSRMNKYGQASACIAHKRPEFREICYCANRVKRTPTTLARLPHPAQQTRKKR